MIVVNVARGQEVMATIAEEVARLGIANGAIVSLIGAVDHAEVSTMSADNYAKDVRTKYDLPLEFSGTGEIVNGKVHVHVVLARQGDKAISGHLHSAQVDHFFVHAYVIPLS